MVASPERRSCRFLRVPAFQPLESSLPPLGRKKDRAGRESLLKAARQRQVDVIVVWRLDRWGRSSPDLVVTLRELIDLGVGFASRTEAPRRPAGQWRRSTEGQSRAT